MPGLRGHFQIHRMLILSSGIQNLGCHRHLEYQRLLDVHPFRLGILALHQLE